MSSIDSLAHALSDRIAAGWIALGGQLAGVAETSVVDIEGLIVATARLEDVVDSRTRGVALDWCVSYGDAVNTVRLKRVATEMKADSATARLATLVAASGGRRWPLASPSGVANEIRGRVFVSDLRGDPRLLWRLRETFGVAARSDILCALLLSDQARSISELARTTRFAKRSVAVATEALTLAGVIELERVGREERVRLAADAPIRSWRPARSGPTVDWVARWRTGIEVLAALRATASSSPAVAAIERRVSADGLRSAIIAGGLRRIDTSVKGEAFGQEYERWATELARTFAKIRKP